MTTVKKDPDSVGQGKARRWRASKAPACPGREFQRDSSIAPAAGPGRRFAQVALALLVAGLLGRGIWAIAKGSEPHADNDEPRHIMTAVYWSDVFRVHPMRDPSGFTYAYYGHFPAIAPLHWPPLTHMMCGALFLATGPSVPVARGMILAMMVVTVLVVYRLTACWAGWRAGLLAAILVAGCPVMALYSTAFMLEVPCLFWMAISLWALGVYVGSGRSRYVWLALMAAVAGVLTKQHAVILAPMLLGGAVLGFRRRHWRDWRLYAAAGTALGLIGAYYGVALSRITSSWQDISTSSGDPVSDLRMAGLEVGLVAVAAGLGGLGLLLRHPRGFWLGWVSVIGIVATLLMYGAMGIKTSRYLVYLVLPLSILGGWALARVAARLPSAWRGPALALVVLAVGGCWQVYRPHEGRLDGYQLAARHASRLADNGVVVFGGAYDGPFVLYRRLEDPALRTITYRTSKLLGGGNILPGRGYRAFVSSPQDVRKALTNTGAKVVVVEDQPEMDTREHRWFWDLLRGPDPEFTLAETVPATYPNGQRGSLRIYRYTGPTQPPTRVEVPMMTLSSGHISYDSQRDLLGWH